MRLFAVGIFGAAVLVASVGGTPRSANAAPTLCGAQLSKFGPASRPFGLSRQLPTLAQAQKRISFTPRLPAGRPFRIYVSRHVELRHRLLGLTYRRSAERWYHLTESAATGTRRDFERFIRDMAARDECGEATAMHLRNGDLALLIEARDRRVLSFRTGELNVLLLASPTSAGRSRLIALANALAD